MNRSAVPGIVFVIGGIIDFNRDVIPDLVRFSLIAVAIVCLACATAFLAFYLINYRPRLRKAEQDTMLLTLQREPHELRSQLPQSPNGSPAAEANDALPRP
jgi:ABC-type Fe3+ transport system permease subunit